MLSPHISETKPALNPMEAKGWGLDPEHQAPDVPQTWR